MVGQHIGVRRHGQVALVDCELEELGQRAQVTLYRFVRQPLLTGFLRPGDELVQAEVLVLGRPTVFRRKLPEQVQESGDVRAAVLVHRLVPDCLHEPANRAALLAHHLMQGAIDLETPLEEGLHEGGQERLVRLGNRR